MIKKALIFVFAFASMQLALMAVILVVFDINLFVVTEPDGASFMSQLSVGKIKLLTLLNQIIGLLFPALLFLFVLYRNNFLSKIGFKPPDHPFLSVFAILLLISSYPFIQFLTEINHALPFSDWMKETGDQIDNYMLEMIRMDDVKSLLINVFIIAILPAVCEEILFRGVIQNELIRHLRNPHLAIVIASVLFSAFHFQFDGFLPRIGVGLLIGYAYYCTKSFFIPVLMHFFNNALMVFSVYLKQDELSGVSIENAGETNFTIVLISLILIGYFIYLIKTKSHDDTVEKIL